MQDTFAITIIFVVLCTVMGAFLRGRTKDRCLKSFARFPVTLEKSDNKVVWGKLRVENSGLEFIYLNPYLDKEDNHIESSYILYKNEYDKIRVLVRFVDNLADKLKTLREKDYIKTRSPRLFARVGRKVRNFFGTVRDSLMEVSTLLLGRVKSAGSVGNVLKGQDKYVSQLQQQAISGLNAAYEPILERYLGKKVVVAIMIDGKKHEYSGFLKDYTTDFIEILDSLYPDFEDKALRKADLIVPRSLALVRHFGE